MMRQIPAPASDHPRAEPVRSAAPLGPGMNTTHTPTVLSHPSAARIARGLRDMTVGRPEDNPLDEFDETGKVTIRLRLRVLRQLEVAEGNLRMWTPQDPGWFRIHRDHEEVAALVAYLEEQDDRGPVAGWPNPPESSGERVCDLARRRYRDAA